MNVTNDVEVAPCAPTRHFCPAGQTPFTTVTWNRRTARIVDKSGTVIFEQENVEAPDFWSDRAVNIVADKYFYGQKGSPERESSVRQLIHRVVNTIADWGLEGGYFDAAGRDAFYDDLVWLCLYQHVSFNSPVWFNTGLHQQYGVTSGKGTKAFRYNPKTDAVEEVDGMVHCQGSACFIVGIDNSIDGIWEYCQESARVFKRGGGVGANWSNLSSTHDLTNGGGRPSGPVSFMRVQDATGSTVRSGGAVRRAAIMMILDDNHPDISEFIGVKSHEEAKARALIREGYEADFNGEAYRTVSFQNANLSVRTSNRFLQACERDEDWQTHLVLTGAPGPKYRARDILHKMAESTWDCGDPGIQYGDTINFWHTVPNEGPIRGSNPCSEFLHLHDTACNLLSLNLLRFRTADGDFDASRFTPAVSVSITAMEILVGNMSYPTEKIARNSCRFRPLGIGYANLGALLMSSGLPYDSDEGRSLAGAITALLTGQAYLTSTHLAERLGAFDGFFANREPMLKVMALHRQAVIVGRRLAPARLHHLWDAAAWTWEWVCQRGKDYGIRNSQASLLAPTGTISFMMDCDTTGIEPELALVKVKNLAGRGQLRMVNRSVRSALERLAYDPQTVKTICAYIEEHGSVDGCPDLKPEHLPVFDCSFATGPKGRSIPWKAHIDMLAAVQPFLSGACSKTINFPSSSTVDDFDKAILYGWKSGLKCFAAYRDLSKESQPLDTVEKTKVPLAKRREPPTTRSSVTHKFVIGGQYSGFLTVGLYEDGAPCEIFLCVSKGGSTVNGFAGAWAKAISYNLQYGTPLEELVRAFSYERFEPLGFTGNEELPSVASIVDYVVRWMEKRFLNGEAGKPAAPQVSVNGHAKTKIASSLAGPPCWRCGAVTVQAGACRACVNCGETSGCG